jgi:hypothetical protein
MILGTTLLGSTVHAGEADSVHFYVEFMDGAKDDPKTKELGPQIVTTLREHVGQTTMPAGADNRLIVVISDMTAAPGEDYLVHLVAISNSDVVGSTEPLACVACGADELAAMAISMLPPMLEAIAAAEPPPVAEPPEPAQTEIEDVPEPVLPSNRKQRTLQIAGTTTAVGGALVLGAGGALLAVGKVFPRDTNGVVIDQIDYRPAGAILVGAGAALVVTGLVCFGLGSRKRSGLVGVAPVLNREVTGATVTLAF